MLSIFSFLSCNKNNDFSKIVNRPERLKLISTIRLDTTGAVRLNSIKDFEYDDLGRLVKWEASVTSDSILLWQVNRFVYDSSNLPIKRELEQDFGGYIGFDSLVYDENNRLVAELHFRRLDDDNTLVQHQKTQYIYNSSNQIHRVEIFSSPDNTLEELREISWQGANIKRIKYSDPVSNTIDYELTFDYDDQPNFECIGQPLLGLYSQNNFTRSELKDHLGNIDGFTVIERFFTYDETGLPKTYREVTNGFSSFDAHVVIVYE